MSTVYAETDIRAAMIRAGYGPEFAQNLDADRLHDYVAAPHVAAILETDGARTRTLLVTLPAMTAEQAESVREYFDGELVDGFTVSGTVAHMLHQPLPPSVRVKTSGTLDDQRVYILDGSGHVTHALEPAEARILAGALHTHANTIEGV